MGYRTRADVILVLHLGFVLFVVSGGVSLGIQLVPGSGMLLLNLLLYLRWWRHRAHRRSLEAA